MVSEKHDKKVRVTEEYIMSSSETYSPGVEMSLKQKLSDGRVIATTVEAEPLTFKIKKNDLSRKSWDTITKVGELRIAKSLESGRVACFQKGKCRFICWLECNDMIKLALDLLQHLGVKRYKTKDGRLQMFIPKKLIQLIPSLANSLAQFEPKNANFPSRSRVIGESDKEDEEK